MTFCNSPRSFAGAEGIGGELGNGLGLRWLLISWGLSFSGLGSGFSRLFSGGGFLFTLG